MDTNEYYLERCRRAVERGQVWAEEYRRGVIVHGWPRRSWAKAQEGTQKPKRGVIKSQSARSLIRAAFAISNSPTDWEVMITLTFRKAHPFPKDCLRAFCDDLWPDGIDRWEACWFQEYQSRGVVHYHLLTTVESLSVAFPGLGADWIETGRGRKRRTVAGGPSGYAVASKWLAIIGDDSSEAWEFNLGGVVEKLSNPEDSGRYMSSYAKKLSQKTLPDNECPQGRWWYMSDLSRPERQGFGKLTYWPLDKPHHLVYDKERLKGGNNTNDTRNNLGAGGAGGANRGSSSDERGREDPGQAEGASSCEVGAQERWVAYRARAREARTE